MTEDGWAELLFHPPTIRKSLFWSFYIPETRSVPSSSPERRLLLPVEVRANTVHLKFRSLMLKLEK